MNDDERRRRAHDTVDQAQQLLLAHDMTAFAALWAPDGTLDFPFAAEGSPTHLTGRDAVRAYLAGYNDVVDPRDITADVRHDTTDPDTLVVEFEVAGTVVATEAPYQLRYVAIISIGDEGITSYRDYWSPLASQAILGAGGLAGAGR